MISVGDFSSRTDTRQTLAEISRINVLVTEANDDFAARINIAKLRLVVYHRSQTFRERRSIEERRRDNSFSGFVDICEFPIRPLHHSQPFGESLGLVPARTWPIET